MVREHSWSALGAETSVGAASTSEASKVGCDADGSGASSEWCSGSQKFGGWHVLPLATCRSLASSRLASVWELFVPRLDGSASVMNGQSAGLKDQHSACSSEEERERSGPGTSGVGVLLKGLGARPELSIDILS